MTRPCTFSCARCPARAPAWVVRLTIQTFGEPLCHACVPSSATLCVVVDVRALIAARANP